MNRIASVHITTTFFSAIDQVILPKSSKNGERFQDAYYITTDYSKIVEIVSPFQQSIGSVETSYLLSAGPKALIYRKNSIDVSTANLAAVLGEMLIEEMLAIKTLQFNLWLLKDNAVHFDRAWIGAQTTQGVHVNSNVWHSRDSLANGAFQPIAFDVEEWRTARSIARPTDKEQAAGLHILSSSSPTMLTSDSLRFQRFQYFVGSARSSADVAMKMAQYCSGIEALVSTAQTELTHQVSERVAAILATPGPERVSLFRVVKEAYGYRSKAVHGASFKSKDAEKLIASAEAIDEICRQLVMAYFEPSTGLRVALEGTDQDASDYFVERILGSPES